MRVVQGWPPALLPSSCRRVNARDCCSPRASPAWWPRADGTDRLVQLVQEVHDGATARGEEPALYGAKITGGGSGGATRAGSPCRAAFRAACMDAPEWVLLPCAPAAQAAPDA